MIEVNVFVLLLLKNVGSVTEYDDCGRGLEVFKIEVNSLLFFLDKLENFDGVRPVVLTVVKIEVACGDNVMLFGTTGVVAADILISEL